MKDKMCCCCIEQSAKLVKAREVRREIVRALFASIIVFGGFLLLIAVGVYVGTTS